MNLSFDHFTPADRAAITFCGMIIAAFVATTIFFALNG